MLTKRLMSRNLAQTAELKVNKYTRLETELAVKLSLLILKLVNSEK